ncbi:hypothetical protein ACS0TY_033344 [Phlomoides rotata]
MGLNESYATTVNQIHMMDPLPTVSKAYSMLMRNEQQNGLQTEVTKVPVQSEPALFTRSQTYVAKGSTTWKKGPDIGKRFRTKEEKDILICSHCGGKRHEASECFKLHGYHEWFDKLKEDMKQVANYTNDYVANLSHDIATLTQQVAQLPGQSLPNPARNVRCNTQGITTYYASLVDYADSRTHA